MLTKSDIHAIRAMAVLAQIPNGEFRGASSIAEVTGAPRNYLGKLLQQLSRRGLAESQKGLGGGFKLARRPNDISLFNIVESIGDTYRWSDCFVGINQCNKDNPCPVHHQWQPVRDSYLELLKKTTLSDLIPEALPKKNR